MADDWYIGTVCCDVAPSDTLSVYRPDKSGHIGIAASGMDATIFLTRDTVIDLMALLHEALTSPDKSAYNPVHTGRN